MKKFKSALFMLIFYLLLSVFCVLVFAEEVQFKGYDNTGIHTTTPEGTVCADGYNLYLNGDLLTDLSTYTDTIKNYTEKQAKTLFITDLSNHMEDGNTVIYIAGLTFTPRAVNYNDTVEYNDMKVKVGLPSNIVMSYNLSTKETRLLLNHQTIGIWAAPYESVWNEKKIHESDRKFYEGSDMLIDFISPSITPKLLASKYREDTVYAIVGYGGSDDPLYRENKGVILLEFDTNRYSDENRAEKFGCLAKQEGFENAFGFVGLKAEEIKYTDFYNCIPKDTPTATHTVSPNNFYMKEQCDGQVAVVSLGDENSTVSTGWILELDNLPGDNIYLGGYWKERDWVINHRN